MKSLNVFYNAKLVGTLLENEEERLEFSYSDKWVNSSKSFSLSLALEVRKDSYGHLITKSFFENLLPEGEVKRVLEKKSSESIEDEFSFLKKYGIDCAGAFVISDSKTISTPEKFKSKEIKLETLYDYLDRKQSLTSAMINNEGGRFYLADTQDSPFNEYFCMKLAGNVGLIVPKVHLINDQYPLYFIERFDRLLEKGTVSRVHEQDFCQAQGLTSRKKYENEGGPTLVDNYNLIKNHSSLPMNLE